MLDFLLQWVIWSVLHLCPEVPSLSAESQVPVLRSHGFARPVGTLLDFGVGFSTLQVIWSLWCSVSLLILEVLCGLICALHVFMYFGKREIGIQAVTIILLAQQSQRRRWLFSRLLVSDSLWPMDRSTPRFPVLHCLLELAQSHVHRVGDAIQPSHPLSSPSPSAFNLSQHQGLFQWVSSSHQVAKVLEFQLQHQWIFQWIFRIDFLQDWLICSPRGFRESSPVLQYAF